MPRALVISCALLVLLPGAGSAQEPESEEETAEAPQTRPRSIGAGGEVILDQVVVTARKVEENLQEVPVSIDTIPQDKLDFALEGGADVLGIAGQAGNLYIEQSNGRTAPRFYIRGLGNTDFDTAASQPVSVLQDEIVMENVLLKAFPIFDIDSVEVARGPQGTVFGRNTTAGVVKFNSKRPSQQTDRSFSISAGNLESLAGEVALGGGINDSWAYRASFMGQHRGDWVDNTFTGQSNALGGFDDFAGRIQLLYENDNFSALFRVHARDLEGTSSIFRANIVGPGNSNLNGNFDRERVFLNEGNGNPQTMEGAGGAMTLEWSLGGGRTLTSVTGYESVKATSLGDIDGGVAGVGPGFIPFDSQTANASEVDQLTQEIRLASDPDQDTTWQVGAFYFDSSLDVTTKVFFIPDSNTVEDASSWALFGQLSRKLNDSFTLTGGLRYTEDEKDLTVRASPIPNGPVNVSDDQVSWDLSLVWNIDSTTNLYGRVANGFRGPSIQSRDVAFFGVPTTAKSETILSYEIGSKSELQGGRLRLNSAIFYYQVDDQQFTAIGGAGNFVRLVNADRGLGYGLEYDVKWQANDRLFLSLGLGLVHTEIDDPDLRVAPCGSGQCTVLDPFDTNGNALVDGNPFPNAPEHTANLGIDYSIPTGQGGWLLSLDYTSIGKTNFFLYESKEYGFDNNWELGLRVGYGWGPQEIAFYGRNLTDETNLIGGIDFNNNAGFVNEPRTIGIAYKRFVF
jgi:outer membrane receptor protein involved in Fe transport